MNTLEIDSEILITMLGAFAQSESESISANVRWGVRQAIAYTEYPHGMSGVISIGAPNGMLTATVRRK